MQQKKAALKARPFNSGYRRRLVLRVEFDDQVRFHHDRVRHIAQARCAHEGRGHFRVIRVDVVRHITLGQSNSFQNNSQLLGLVTDFDHVAFFDAVGRDVDPLAVHFDVAVVHELTCGKHGRQQTWRGRRRRPDGAPADRSGFHRCRL